MKALIGTGVALITPMHENGDLDFEGLKSLLEFVSPHVDYLVVMGTTGESATMSRNEKKAVLKFVLENNTKNLPVVYGIGGNNTVAVIEELKTTDLQGVTAILSVSPYYNKPSQKGIIAHFTAIADASSLPIILYNVPGRTSSNMNADTTNTLSQHENIVAIKDASGDINQCQDIMNGKSDDFLLLSGEDLFTSEMMKIGASGVISVLANGFPEDFSKIANLARAGRFDESDKISESFETINPLMYEESNPVGVKEVLRLKGVCNNYVRLPLLPASDDLKSRIALLVK